MKILVYSQSYYPNLGGLERNTSTLCRTLTKLGHDVTLLTETKDPQKAENVEDFKILRTSNTFLYAKAIGASDLVIVNGGIALKICIWTLLFGNRYYIVYQTANAYLRHGKGVFNRLNNWLRRYFTTKADLNISVSEFGLKFLDTISKRTFLLLNPIDYHLEAKVAKHTLKGEKKNSVLFAGRVIEGKGIYILAEAVSILKTEYRLELPIVIAGVGEEMEMLKATCATLGIDCTFKGKIDADTLVNEYCNARVLVVPSSTHTEGNPLVIAEAITCGLPVIVSDQPAMVETIGGAGRYFASGDARGLASELLKIYNDQLHYEKLLSSCMELKKKFSTDSYIDSLKTILSK